MTSVDTDSVLQTGDSLVEFKVARERLSYSLHYKDPVRKTCVQFLEWVSAKRYVMRTVDLLESQPRPSDHRIWRELLNQFGVNVDVTEGNLTNIPEKGSAIVVANHPYGIVDSVILADLIGRRRPDYKILTRDFLSEINEVLSKFTISVPFANDPDWRRKSVKMRNEVMSHLAGGGLIALFPGGSVSGSRTFFGDAEDDEWKPFTAQLIRRSGARVVPVRFHGQNSRLYQIARRFSKAVGQGMLLGEAIAQCNKSQKVTVGEPITRDHSIKWDSDPRAFMEWLRKHTRHLSNGG